MTFFIEELGFMNKSTKPKLNVITEPNGTYRFNQISCYRSVAQQVINHWWNNLYLPVHCLQPAWNDNQPIKPYLIHHLRLALN